MWFCLDVEFDCARLQRGVTSSDCRRYVTRERLEAMLDYEYLQCDLTLRSARGDNTAFFCFADTVVAKVDAFSNARAVLPLDAASCGYAVVIRVVPVVQAYNRNNECHGWLGIKYQSSPR